MIARFWFEFVPSKEEFSIFNVFIMAVALLLWGFISIHIVELLESAIDKIFKINERVRYSDKKDNLFMLILYFLIFLPLLLIPLSTNFLNKEYMAEYANGNYKYSNIMKYCIKENKHNYSDEELEKYSSNTIAGTILCFNKERDAFIEQENQEKKAADEAKEAARKAAEIEQIRKEVR
jgi:hypothetical protein